MKKSPKKLKKDLSKRLSHRFTKKNIFFSSYRKATRKFRKISKNFREFLQQSFHRIDHFTEARVGYITALSKKLLKDISSLFHNKRFCAFTCVIVSIFILLGSAFYLLVIKDLPNPLALQRDPIPQTTIIRDRNGVILYKVYKNANRIKLDWEEIPTVVKNATLAIEDSDFYHHPGFSVKAILRAVLYNIYQNNVKSYQGASTITMQLLKNRFFDNNKTFQRKIKEMVLSVFTERVFSKNEILTMYLNEVGYGGPAYGIEAASQMFFGKSVKDLGLAEAALIAGLPASPTTFSPFGSRPELAIARHNLVLDRMLDLKMISKNQYEEAKNQELNFIAQKIDILAPHFVMYVKDELTKKLGAQTMEIGGLDITTTLDYSIQLKAEEVVKQQIESLGDRYNIHNAGVLVTHPKTGEILAMVGSVNYFDVENKGYVNVTNSLRQPGSAIKPLNYAYAFDHGYNPNTTIEDSPVVYTAKGISEVYAPVNYDRQFHGIVTVRSALANSYNVPAVKTLNKMGVDNMLTLGKKMGITSWDNIPPIGLSLTLGGAEVTMLEMAKAYGVFSNMGVKKELAAVRRIMDSNGNDLTRSYFQSPDDKKNQSQSLVKVVEAADGEQVISPLSAYWINDILSDNKARLPAFGRYSRLEVPGHKVAVKTGTSNNFRDNWTIGYTPDYLVATWVGNNDGAFMNSNLVSGITGAAPIWNEVMTSLIGNSEPVDFPVPSGLIPVKICATNGLLTCPNCPQEKTEYFTADKVPTQKCFFKSFTECDEARKQAEGKSDDEKKQILWGCSSSS